MASEHQKLLENNIHLDIRRLHPVKIQPLLSHLYFLPLHIFLIVCTWIYKNDYHMKDDNNADSI